jgi:hypothetical protein
MATENVTEVSDEELRQLPNSPAQFDSEFVRKRILEMDWRSAERQLEAARQLSAFTKQLVNATRVLVIATVALFLASVVQIVLVLKK